MKQLFPNAICNYAAYLRESKFVHENYQSITVYNKTGLRSCRYIICKNESPVFCLKTHFLSIFRKIIRQAGKLLQRQSLSANRCRNTETFNGSGNLFLGVMQL